MTKEEAIARRLKEIPCCPDCGSKKLRLITEIMDCLYIKDSQEGTVEGFDIDYLLDKNPIDTCDYIECPKCSKKIKRGSEEFLKFLKLDISVV